MSQEQYNTWVRALEIIDFWFLVPEDEQHDNEIGKDGDGTSWNMALRRIKGRFEEEREKAQKVTP